MLPKRELKEIDVGRVLNQLITLQTKDNSEDFGSYTDYKQVYASYELGRSKIVSRNKAEDTKLFAVFIVRHAVDVDETMRIKHGSNLWQIESVMPLSYERLYKEITCYRFKPDLEATHV